MQYQDATKTLAKTALYIYRECLSIKVVELIRYYVKSRTKMGKRCVSFRFTHTNVLECVTSRALLRYVDWYNFNAKVER